MFGSGILETELKSFRKLIQYIKKTDEGQQTVIALQIENEVGILDAARDFSAAAAEAFEKNVPVELLEHKAVGTYFRSILAGNVRGSCGRSIYVLALCEVSQ